jgi:mono/diheme cytochrome c family protein
MRRRSSIALVVLALLAVGLLAAGCGSGEQASPTPETVIGEVPTTAETTPSDLPALALEGNAEAGADVFASAGCGGCHTLSAAGSSGSVGPNLDDSKPSVELVVERVTKGQGGMPAFSKAEGGALEDQQIADVAAYVAESAGS